VFVQYEYFGDEMQRITMVAVASVCALLAVVAVLARNRIRLLFNMALFSVVSPATLETFAARRFLFFRD
jgi:hypothetical protein